MTRMLSLIILVLGGFGSGLAEGACAPGGTCGPTNSLVWANATTNVDGTALNNFAAFDARIGTAPGACTSGSSVLRDLGNFGLGSTPAAGTSQVALNAAALGLPSGPVYLVLHTRTTAGVRSACSAEIAFTYDAAPTQPPPTGDTTAPSVPGAFGATVVGTGQIDLTWTASTDNVGVTGYELERCTGAGCTAFAKLVAPTGTSYSNTGLAAATTYRYRLRAMDAIPNPSPYSPIISATTQGSLPAGTATTVVCVAASCKLEWPPTAGATAYRVARWTTSAWTPVVTTSATSVNISWLTGVNEYGLFAIMPSGEAVPTGRVWTSK